MDTAKPDFDLMSTVAPPSERAASKAKAKKAKKETVPGAAGRIEKKPAAARRGTRRGDIRAELTLSATQGDLIKQVVMALRPLVQFRRGPVMCDDKGVALDALALQVQLYKTCRPSRNVSPQAIKEACKHLAEAKNVPTAVFMSALPQLTRAGTVQLQPGAVGSRVYTTFQAGTLTGFDTFTAFDTESKGVKPVPITYSIRDFIDPADAPIAGDPYPLTHAARPVEDVEYDCACMLAALVAPRMCEFPGAVNFLMTASTAEWLLPLVKAEFVNALVPTKSKISILRRDMVSAVAVHGDDQGACSVVKAILSGRDCPVYTVGEKTREGAPTIHVFEGARPCEALCNNIESILTKAMRAAVLPAEGEVTFVQALDAILLAANLPLCETILSIPAPVVSSAPKKGKVVAEAEEEMDAE